MMRNFAVNVVGRGSPVLISRHLRLAALQAIERVRQVPTRKKRKQSKRRVLPRISLRPNVRLVGQHCGLPIAIAAGAASPSQ